MGDLLQLRAGSALPVSRAVSEAQQAVPGCV